MCQSWDSSFEFEVLLLMLEKNTPPVDPKELHGRACVINASVPKSLVHDTIRLENFESSRA